MYCIAGIDELMDRMRGKSYHGKHELTCVEYLDSFHAYVRPLDVTYWHFEQTVRSSTVRAAMKRGLLPGLDLSKLPVSYVLPKRN